MTEQNDVLAQQAFHLTSKSCCLTKATAAYGDEIIPVGAVILCSTATAGALKIMDYRCEIHSSAGAL